MAEDDSMPAHFSYLAGQIHALRCVVAAFAAVLRDHPQLQAEFESATQHGLVNLEKTRTSVHTIDGFQETVGPLRKLIEGLDE